MSDILERLKTALADRYVIERELGAGGMATVYLAQDVRHSRQVALKVLRPDLSAVLGADRFLQEIRVTARLQHPHILPLHDSGVADGLLFYVMPFVRGESLRARLNRDGRLELPVALAITEEVADALSYAHRQGLVHRDVKPENVLLAEGHAVVTDFGIAKAVAQSTDVLLDLTGKIRVRESGKHAYKTIVAETETGHILVFKSLGAVRLYDIGQCFKDALPAVRQAMAMDGGSSSEIRILESLWEKDLQVQEHASWKSLFGGGTGSHIPLPTVIGASTR